MEEEIVKEEMVEEEGEEGKDYNKYIYGVPGRELP